MSVFVILGLLVSIETPGSTAVTPVFVQKGNDVLLNVSKNVPEFDLLVWTFSGKDNLVRFSPGKEPTITPTYTGRVEFSKENYSVKLKNLQETDSGVYTARGIADPDQLVAEYNVTVLSPVSPVELTVDSGPSSSDSCNLTVTCRTQDSHISSTFTCVNQVCSDDGEASTSGAVLHVYYGNHSIICNHSNQVSWNKGQIQIQDFCLFHIAGFSFCLVKTVVFSVGLILMVSAVVSVHLMERIKKKPEPQPQVALHLSCPPVPRP